jgi:hypothetical protein
MRIHHLVLGLAASVLLASAAHATDAVVDDQPKLMGSDPVNTCDAYGTGFAKLPGTNTCVRVSGQMRYEKSFSNSSRSGSLGRTTLDFETRSD